MRAVREEAATVHLGMTWWLARLTAQQHEGLVERRGFIDYARGGGAEAHGAVEDGIHSNEHDGEDGDGEQNLDQCETRRPKGHAKACFWEPAEAGTPNTRSAARAWQTLDTWKPFSPTDHGPWTKINPELR